MRTWLRNLRKAFRAARPRRPAGRRHRPALEALDDRRLLTGGFVQTNLVADTAGVAAHTDTNLVNAWGIAFGPGGPFWIANNGTGTSTLYDGTGATAGAPVGIPPLAATPTATAAPTGTVFNGNANEFLVNGPGTAAFFLFATEDGTISAWDGGASAVLKVDNAAGSDVYKGLALANQGGSDFLYATDFRHGVVDVFNSSFQAPGPGGPPSTFTDPALTAMGFAPFGIQNIGGNLFVTFAKQDAAKHDDVAGPGNGFIDVFTPNGTMVQRLVSNGALNSPWGLAVAPAGFGSFGGDLLVGNFGDGGINAFNPSTGASLGPLTDTSGTPIKIDGLWGLAFGGGGLAGSPDTLFFTAGPAGETHGLFGSLQAVTNNPPPPPPPPPAAALTDVSAVVSVTLVKSKHHHNPNQLQETVRNNSGSVITGPLFVILDGLPKKVRLRDASGSAQAHGKPGDPFETINLSAFEPGQTVNLSLAFRNPGGKHIHFSTIVLAGPGTV
jgi:uncharacterized protein (TIGR03118 family)